MNDISIYTGQITRHRQLVEETVDTTLTREQRILMATLGLIGEYGEASRYHMEAALPPTDEAGDVLWYVHLMLLQFDLSLSDTFIPALLGYRAEPSILSEIAETVKKHIYHGRELAPETVIRQMSCIVRSLLDMDIDINESLAANETKLRRRYPTGFVTGGGLRDADTGISK